MITNIKLQKLITLLLLSGTIFFSSCYSLHSHLDKQACIRFNELEKKQAFIINQSEFPKEYKILKKSKLYLLTNDSNAQLKIRMHKLENLITIRCMTGPTIAILFTLGQWPFKIPENYNFKFDEIKNGEIKNIDYKLEIDRRIWFWDIFSWRKSYKRELALSLRFEKIKLIKH